MRAGQQWQVTTIYIIFYSHSALYTNDFTVRRGVGTVRLRRHIYVRICMYNNYIYDMYAIRIYERETRQAYSPEGVVCMGEGVEVERRARVARKRVSDNWYANNSAPAAARAGRVCLSAGPHADLVLYSARDYRGTRAPPTPLTLRTISTACRRPHRHRRFRFCHSATIYIQYT